MSKLLSLPSPLKSRAEYKRTPKLPPSKVPLLVARPRLKLVTILIREKRRKVAVAEKFSLALYYTMRIFLFLSVWKISKSI